MDYDTYRNYKYELLESLGNIASEIEDYKKTLHEIVVEHKKENDENAQFFRSLEEEDGEFFDGVGALLEILLGVVSPSMR